MDEEVDVEELISRVKEKPVLWDRSIEDRGRSVLTFVWREVATSLHPAFDSLSEKEQAHYTRYIMKKWTNIKDCWVKSQRRVMLQQQQASGGRKKPPKRYCYDKHLTFLKRSFSASKQYSASDGESMANGGEDDDPLASDASSTENSILPHRRKAAAASAGLLQWGEANPITPKVYELQENRHMFFFKAILPSLEAFNEQQVLEFQMGVLNILHNIRETQFTEAVIHKQEEMSDS